MDVNILYPFRVPGGLFPMSLLFFFPFLAGSCLFMVFYFCPFMLTSHGGRIAQISHRDMSPIRLANLLTGSISF